MSITSRINKIISRPDAYVLTVVERHSLHDRRDAAAAKVAAELTRMASWKLTPARLVPAIEKVKTEVMDAYGANKDQVERELRCHTKAINTAAAKDTQSYLRGLLDGERPASIPYKSMGVEVITEVDDSGPGESGVTESLLLPHQQAALDQQPDGGLVADAGLGGGASVLTVSRSIESILSDPTEYVQDSPIETMHKDDNGVTQVQVKDGVDLRDVAENIAANVVELGGTATVRMVSPDHETSPSPVKLDREELKRQIKNLKDRRRRAVAAGKSTDTIDADIAALEKP